MNISASSSLNRFGVFLFTACLALLAGVCANAQEMPGVTALYSNTFFRVAGKTPLPKYTGAQACTECHARIHSTEMDTKHAGALQTLKNIHQENNASCLPCHTVGYGLPGGFVSASATPQLGGVQCESCHGPASKHIANPSLARSRPLTEVAGTMCGGCHTGSHDPQHDEWSMSAHATVTEDMNPTSRINACGRCHSGASRNSLLHRRSMPVRKANVPVGCVACHDPHAKHVWTNVLTGVHYTNQLRNPISSTNDYSLATTDVFKKKYDPNINVCGQCHNQRGASWKSSSRPPHHSSQYNLLVGNAGELPSGQKPFLPGGHAMLAKQCVHCHMQTAPFQSESQPAVTGHRFKVESYNACYQCHPYPDLLVDFTKMSVTNQIQDLKFALDLWATTKAPAALRAKYGALAWEYTNKGGLSSGGSSPNADEQKLIPANIQKARFNLYLVYNEGSLGVHNGPHTIQLLDAAEDWVLEELNR